MSTEDDAPQIVLADTRDPQRPCRPVLRDQPEERHVVEHVGTSIRQDADRGHHRVDRPRASEAGQDTELGPSGEADDVARREGRARRSFEEPGGERRAAEVSRRSAPTIAAARSWAGTPARSNAPMIEPADVPTTTSASRGSQRRSLASAASAPAW